MNYIYTITIEDGMYHEYRLLLGTWCKKEYAIASAFNRAPQSAKITFHDLDGAHELRSGNPDDDEYETYNIREVRLESRVFFPPPPRLAPEGTRATY